MRSTAGDPNGGCNPVGALAGLCVVLALVAACGRIDYRARLAFDGAVLDAAVLDGAAIDSAAIDSAVLDGAALDGGPAPCGAFSAWGGVRRIAELSTIADDLGPHVAADGLTLYFDSLVSGSSRVFVTHRTTRTAP